MCDTDLKSALKFISRVCTNVCRLCLHSTDPDADGVNIHKFVHVETPYYKNEMTYQSIFQELQVLSESALPDVLCVNCATLTVNTFLFKKLCEYSQQQWQTSFNTLNKIVAQSETLNTRAACVFFNVCDDEMLTSYCPISKKTKKNVIAKLQKNMKIRLKRKDEKRWIQKKIPCPICPKTFSKLYELESHKEAVHYPKTIQCDLCDKVFSTDRLLHKHKKLNHIKLICNVCSQEFSSRHCLRSHMEKHCKNSLKSSIDKQDKNTLKYSSQLKLKEQNTCPRCDKEFVSRNSYKFHLKNCGQFICDMCGKHYSVKASFKVHLACSHGFGSKVLSCKWCHKTFLNSCSLKRHEVKHTKERNFSCEICKAKFVTDRALICHRRLHTGERPYPCDICGERFLNTSRRMMHKRRAHLGPDKKCKICSAKFYMNRDLQRHNKTHESQLAKDSNVAEINSKSGLASGKSKVIEC
ncbi:zinc finger protein 540-like [Aricia agestis]|uniref:zinc finger protein 540-like n=1 Tax=Aricia agestis TaxID=91739 RepID=UPI001C2024F8|nr:zinc finger protein 540-like [Aricia agestis]